MKDPLVSIFVASYNHAQYIEECINSIYKQTYRNIELIVIDDGSSDGSHTILQKLSYEYNFYYRWQENSGLCNTLNRALSLVQGKYVCFFASDDIMMLDRIEKQVAIMESNSHAGACSGNILMINDVGVIISKQKIRKSRVLEFDDLFLNRVPGAPAPTIMMRKSVLDIVGGYDPEIKIEDIYMCLKITKAGYPIIYSNDIYAYYRQHGASTHSKIHLMFENEMRIIEEYKEHPKYPIVVKSLIARTFVRAAKLDKNFAEKLFFKFPVLNFPMKYIKGIWRFLFC